MQQLSYQYTFDSKHPLPGSYQDTEITNSSYKAIRNSDGKDVQLVIYKSTKPGQINSYFKKINKFAQIKHFNLTPILDCIQDPQKNQLAIVLEWTPGYSLKQFLADSVLHWRTAYFIVRDLLYGLSQVHKQGLTFSFINLQNIQIVQGRGRLSLRYLIYKTYYLSPQVKQNHQKSKESDLFSVGVCLFRLIFGTLPFKSKTHSQFVRAVKEGCPKKIPSNSGSFPKIIPTQLQQYINTLCHFEPQQRGRYLDQQSKVEKLMKLVKPINKQLMASILGQNYILLSIEEYNQQQIRGSVLSTSKRKSKQQKKIFHIQTVRHNLTEISTYIDQIVGPFKNAANLYFANVHEFYVVQKDCLVILYDYCPQSSLKEFNQFSKFTKQMTQEVAAVLKSLLSQWKGQYRFLTNQQILINNGKPVLKYPPFPTSRLKGKLKLSKKGNYFIAPEVEAGIQSLCADSWSVGVIEYWMRFNCMPEFKDDVLQIKDSSELTPQKIDQFTQLISRKHKERKNMFPLEMKPRDRKVSSDSSHSQMESPRLSSRIKSIPSAANAIRLTQTFNSNEIAQDIEQFQIISPKLSTAKMPKTRKNMKGEGTSKEQFQSQIQRGKELQVIKKSKQKGQQRKEQNIFDGQDIRNSQINLIQNRQSPASKQVTKRFPTFSGAKDEKINKRNTIQNSNNKSSYKTKQSELSRRKTLEQTLGVQQADMSQRMFSGLAKEGYNLSLIDKHWTKPIRVFIKASIALIIFIFAFYFNFLSINGDLMKSRYDFSKQLVYLRSDSLSTTPTINFTSVTRTPLETYDALNNKTLTYVRDSLQCVTNDYNNNSNVVDIIISGSFGTYQAFGFIIVIFNLILLCLTLAKLDLPKALTLSQFEDHFYTPLYNWFFVNLALASLTSCTYLNYGGLFSLQLDPCLSRSSFPSLTFLLKNEKSSFTLRFLWVYLGIAFAYFLIIYLVMRPKNNLHKYVYGCLFMLYIGGIAVRSLGTYTSAIYSVFGACGQCLGVLAGIPLALIDLISSWRLRKIQKGKNEVRQVSEMEVQETEGNLNQ